MNLHLPSMQGFLNLPFQLLGDVGNQGNLRKSKDDKYDSNNGYRYAVPLHVIAHSTSQKMAFSLLKKAICLLLLKFEKSLDKGV